MAEKTIWSADGSAEIRSSAHQGTDGCPWQLRTDDPPQDDTGEIIIDTAARLFLFFSHPELIIPLIVLGFMVINPRYFFELSCLTLSGLVINVALKGLFHIQLHPGLSGLAFPSGHMQFSTIFYAYLALFPPRKLNRSLRILSILLTLLVLSAIAWSLIHLGYHTLTDVAGALVTALLLIGLFRIAVVTTATQAPWLTLVVTGIAMIANGLEYETIPQHGIFAGYALFGLVAAETLLRRFGIFNVYTKPCGAILGRVPRPH